MNFESNFEEKESRRINTTATNQPTFVAYMEFGSVLRCSSNNGSDFSKSNGT